MTLVMKRFALLGVCLLAGCPNGKPNYPQPGTLKTTAEVVAKLDEARKARTSFRVQTLMDYWLGKDRAKGTVWVMGTAQRQVRFNALKPDGNVLIDMACDGTNFTYVDFQNNCQIAGPCSKSSIAALLRVELEPDDFHHLAQGTPPTLDAGATGTVAWDSTKGYLKVKLEGAGGIQNLTIDARENRFDVLAAELTKDGKTVWSVENTDFRTIEDAKQVKHRVPGKTRFKSPQQQADLLVEWKDEDRAINLALDAPKFTVPIPEGLPRCGATVGAN